MHSPQRAGALLVCVEVLVGRPRSVGRSAALGVVLVGRANLARHRASAAQEQPQLQVAQHAAYTVQHTTAQEPPEPSGPLGVLSPDRM